MISDSLREKYLIKVQTLDQQISKLRGQLGAGGFVDHQAAIEFDIARIQKDMEQLQKSFALEAKPQVSSMFAHALHPTSQTAASEPAYPSDIIDKVQDTTTRLEALDTKIRGLRNQGDHPELAALDKHRHHCSDYNPNPSENRRK